MATRKPLHQPKPAKRPAAPPVPSADDLQAQSDAELNQSAADDAEEARSEAGTLVHTDTLAAHSNLAPGAAALAARFKRVKAVAVPLFKLVANSPMYVKADGPIFTGKKVDDKKEAAELLPVIDLATGEEGQIIVGKVLRELLLEKYPEHGYVGRSFQVTLRKRADKKYNTYDLFEVEDAEA